MLTSLKFLLESPNYIMVIAAGIIPAYPASDHPSINSGQTKTVIYLIVLRAKAICQPSSHKWDRGIDFYSSQGVFYPFEEVLERLKYVILS